MRVLKRLSVGLVTVATMLTLAQGSAFASKPAISPQGVNSSAPCWSTTSSAGGTTVFIGSDGHCVTDSSSDFLMGVVTITADSSTKWTVTVFDQNCDSIGDFWKAHEAGGGQFNLGDANGCTGLEKYDQGGGGSSYTITKSELATTSVNWWVLWGGYNSPSFSFPT